jgi:hypothetical protein
VTGPLARRLAGQCVTFDVDWRAGDVADQVEFGRWLRAHIPAQTASVGRVPEATAADVAAWVDRHLSPP